MIVLNDWNEVNRRYKGYLKMPATIDHHDTYAVSISWDEGGANFMTGGTRLRGYRFSWHPCCVSHTKTGFFSEESCLLGSKRKSGAYILLERAGRYNKKRLLELAAILDPSLEIIMKYIWSELDKGAIELVTALVKAGLNPPECLALRDPMKQGYLYRVDGTYDLIQPDNTKNYNLEEMYRLLNCDMIEVVPLRDGRILVIDEEGKLKEPVVKNDRASLLYDCERDFIAGDCLVCPNSFVR